MKRMIAVIKNMRYVYCLFFISFFLPVLAQHTEEKAYLFEKDFQKEFLTYIAIDQCIIGKTSVEFRIDHKGSLVEKIKFKGKIPLALKTALIDCLRKTTLKSQLNYSTNYTLPINFYFSNCGYGYELAADQPAEKMQKLKVGKTWPREHKYIKRLQKEGFVSLPLLQLGTPII